MLDEIITKPQERITIDSSLLLGKLKEKTIIEKLCLLNSTNDLKGINYNKYGTIGHRIHPISPIFCDNFILSTPRTMVEKKNADVGLYNQRINIVLSKHKQSGFIKAVGYNGERQKYKISCNSIPLDVVKKIITDKELTDHRIELEDIDITQDFSGSFNKKDVVESMLGSGFRLQGEEGYDEDDATILDNSNSVGDNCLTFMDKNEYGTTIRSKIYNKFVQEIESDSVRDNFGHHIHGWCTESGFQKDTVKKALQNGIIRIETTFYSKYVPTQEEMQSSFKLWRRILKPNVCYSTPISKQWEVVTERISRNLVIKTDKTIAVCHWINSLTGKVGGVIKETKNLADFHWMVAELTFQKPIDIIFVDREEEMVSLSTCSFVKEPLEEGNTCAQLVTRKCLYQKCVSNPTEYGIFICNNVGFYGNKKDSNKKSKSRFVLQENPDIITINYIDKKRFATKEVQQMINKNKEYKKKIEERKRESKGPCLSELVRCAKNSYGQRKGLTNLQKGVIVSFMGAVEQKTRYGKTYALIATNNDVYWSNTSITNFLNKLKPDGTHDDKAVIRYRFDIRINEITLNAYNNRVAIVDIVNVTEVILEDVKKIEPKLLPERTTNLQPKDYKKLEQVDVGTTILVKMFGVINVRGQDRYVLYTDKGNFIDNWFLRQEYDKLEKPLREHKIICRGFKTTKQNVKAMSVAVLEILNTD